MVAKIIIDYLNSSDYFEYKQVLLDGMKNSPPIEDSEILIEMLEGKAKQISLKIKEDKD